MSVSEAVQVIERFVREVNTTERAVKVRNPDYWERKHYTGSGDWMRVSTHAGAVHLGLNSGSLILHGPISARIVDNKLELTGYTRAVWWREHGSEQPAETFYDKMFVLMLAPGEPPASPSRPFGLRVFFGTLAALVLVGLVVMPFGLLSAVEDAEHRTAFAAGGVTQTDSTYAGKGVSGQVCAYTFAVDGHEFNGKDRCPSDTRIGDSAPVLYEPGNPSNNRAWWTTESEQKNSYWGFGVWLLFLAAFFVTGSAYVRSRRNTRSARP